MGSQSSWRKLFSKRFLLPRRFLLSIIVAILCIAIGIFPITQRFEKYVFEPPVLDVAISNCSKPANYQFFLKDSKVVMEVYFADSGPLRPGIVYDQGIVNDGANSGREDGYCNWAILDVSLEGEDGAFEPTSARIIRGDKGVTGSELTYGAYHGGRWMAESSEYLGEQLYDFALSDFVLDEEFTLFEETQSSCTRNRFEVITEGQHPGNRIRVNGQKFCINRSAIPHFKEKREDIASVFKSFLRVVDTDEAEGFVGLENYADMEDAALDEVVKERTDRYFNSPTGISAISVEFACNSCISPITRSFAFKVRGASRRVDQTTPISIYSDYQYLPETLAHIPEQRPLTQDELVNANNSEPAIHMVRYKHRDGFFNLDFYQILSSIFIGIGITILIEISISAKPGNRIAASPAHANDPINKPDWAHRGAVVMPADKVQMKFDLTGSSRVSMTSNVGNRTAKSRKSSSPYKPVKNYPNIDSLSTQDARYLAAMLKVVRHNRANASWLQREMGVGYNHATAWIERMERDGLLGAPNQLGRRSIYPEKIDLVFERNGWVSKDEVRDEE